MKYFEDYELASPSSIASFGYDEVRFHQPLRPGDEVHLAPVGYCAPVNNRRDARQ